MKEGNWATVSPASFLLEEKLGEQTEAGPRIAAGPVSFQPGYPKIWPLWDLTSGLPFHLHVFLRKCSLPLGLTLPLSPTAFTHSRQHGENNNDEKPDFTFLSLIYKWDGWWLPLVFYLNLPTTFFWGRAYIIVPILYKQSLRQQQQQQQQWQTVKLADSFATKGWARP